MTAALGDLIRNRPPWATLLMWYLRAIALMMIVAGLIHWARIVGVVPWRDVWFTEMPAAWQAATVFYAVLDLVVAVGLWLMVSWGKVMWLFRVVCQILMHTVFADVFARRPYEIAFLIATVAVFAVLQVLAERERARG